MAWYDVFTPNSIGKHGRRVQERDAQAEDRLQSAQWLADQNTPEALVALCKRFNLQLEHQMKDRTEKDAVIELLVEKGPQGAEAARHHARRSPNFQHSIRAIERIEGTEPANSLLVELLAAETVENEFKPEKKRTLLLTLAERKDTRIVDVAIPFLLDFDEGVRHAAVEAIAAQEGDAGRPALEKALKSTREESTRVRGRLAEIFATRRWPVEDEDGWFSAHVPSGYQYVNGRLVVER